MLVLSRKAGEEIVIADGLITIVVTTIRGNKVSLGVKCPRDIEVHRGEVYAAIQAERAGKPSVEVVIAPEPVVYPPITAK